MTEQDVEQSPEPPEKDDISSYVKTDSVWTNFLLAALFCNFIYFYYVDFTQNQKFSSFLMMFQVCFIVMFFLLRVYPRKVSFEPKDWVVALVGTWLPMALLPRSDGFDIPIVMLFQLIGILISTIGILSLNSSFGIVPALRTVKTGGLYRLVRHPIYFGYCISFSCIVIQNFTLLNLLVLVGIIACDVMRIIAEEKILMQDPFYQMYQARVRWRLIPFVW